mmetsp:Transcript_51291/g.124990  ORF Transcript_51291/g.124990 Transcript_51291/m.124990 type:complete len:517 (+) Transcript_51291:2768-4318(+)
MLHRQVVGVNDGAGLLVQERAPLVDDEAVVDPELDALITGVLSGRDLEREAKRGVHGHAHQARPAHREDAVVDERRGRALVGLPESGGARVAARGVVDSLVHARPAVVRVAGGAEVGRLVVRGHEAGADRRLVACAPAARNLRRVDGVRARPRLHVGEGVLVARGRHVRAHRGEVGPGGAVVVGHRLGEGLRRDGGRGSDGTVVGAGSSAVPHDSGVTRREAELAPGRARVVVASLGDGDGPVVVPVAGAHGGGADALALGRLVGDHAHVDDVVAQVAGVAVHVLGEDGEGRGDARRGNRQAGAVDRRRRAADDGADDVDLLVAVGDGLRLDEEVVRGDDLLGRRGRLEPELAEGEARRGLVLERDVVEHSALGTEGARVLLPGGAPPVDDGQIVDVEPHAVVAVGVERVHLRVVGAHKAGPARAELVGDDGRARGRGAAAPVEVDVGVDLRHDGAEEVVGREVGAKEALVRARLLHVGRLNRRRVGARAGDDVGAAVLAVLVPDVDPLSDIEGLV